MHCEMTKIWLLALLFAIVNVPRVYAEDALTYLNRNGVDPESYIIQKFDRSDVVLLAEDHAVQNNLLFVQGLIPKLYDAGVRNLGMEFGAWEDQETLDALLSAPAYDPQAARDLMYSYNVAWPYREYQDMYRAAWAFNRGLPEGAEPFRILNLSYRYDWRHFGVGDARTPENMNAVFAKGTPDMYRAEVIEREVLEKNQKILVLTGTVHAFSRFEMPVFNSWSDHFCDVVTWTLGNRLFQKYPDRVLSIALHQPFPARANSGRRLVSPANGKIERLMHALGGGPMGFDLDSPVGALTDSSSYSICDAGFTLRKLFDGYIYLAPLADLEGATVDPEFFTGRDWEDIRQQLPDPDFRGETASLDALKKHIHDYVNLKWRYGDVLSEH
ncbi:hypothetical protein GNX18_01625 [Microbulbifer sp. SH-1]|uniref:hypothetical protein n=1 Tax=Microbulbifer sp. SH-1 TaxID=2681547 RepID=UPI0014085F37|nr:hypothetical protein [Microbulbifer sp. SH-1]QIL88612.1 hypothetical protein GNX18_01625 [Microbulbifer sp. SH-1]